MSRIIISSKANRFKLQLQVFTVIKKLFCVYVISLLLLQLNIKIFFGLILFSSSILFFYSILQKDVVIPSVSVLIFLQIILYLWGIITALYCGNDIGFIMQDSAGILILLTSVPIFLILRKVQINRYEIEQIVLKLSIPVALLHYVLYYTYFFYFKEVTYEGLIAANIVMLRLGTVIKYSTNALAELRVDSNLFIVLVLAIFINVNRINVNTKYRLLFLLFLEVALFFEGHRVLFIVTNVIVVSNLIYFSMKSKSVRDRVFLLFIGFSIALFVYIVLLGRSINIARFTSLFSKDSSINIDSFRIKQVPYLFDKIRNNPIIGNGFGSHANLIRNINRPFLYELDYLAVVMKLGIIASSLYFISYISVAYCMIKTIRKNLSIVSILSLFFVYYIFAATNAGLAMSVISSSVMVIVVIYYYLSLLDKLVKE